MRMTDADKSDRARRPKLTKAERRAILVAAGWVRISGYGAECWEHPARPSGTFSLAAAWRFHINGWDPAALRPWESAV
jgi:hypothetical protein